MDEARDYELAGVDSECLDSIEGGGRPVMVFTHSDMRECFVVFPVSFRTPIQ